VFILKIDKVVCFVALLEVFILKNLDLSRHREAARIETMEDPGCGANWAALYPTNFIAARKGAQAGVPVLLTKQKRQLDAGAMGRRRRTLRETVYTKSSTLSIENAIYKILKRLPRIFSP